ncbi:DNA topoisomerase 1like [Caligus rogercresseyi]|uniref:DNA topoisomerase n=1 Tax=Caligus rogercresseyi TaxID=217165 RepID=A0A7T8QWL7_CALRO|nr:DNA topoisomerase 1like [Caligus rogercresseyi]
MLNPSSKLKGEKDMMKYEKARELKSKIGKIRDDYVVDFKSKEMRVRQRSVALYFIDKLALRAGNEKDEDQADTWNTSHYTLRKTEFCVEFDFLGKDSIRYHNIVPVEKRVFKNLQLFMENKKGEDDLFDRLNTTILNEYLNSLMKGLTAKVFRTYNASLPYKNNSRNSQNPMIMELLYANTLVWIPTKLDRPLFEDERCVNKSENDVDIRKMGVSLHSPRLLR